MKFLFAQKEYMTELFTDKGEVVPVTVLSVPALEVAQEKTAEKDGYSGLKIGIGERRGTVVPKANRKSDGSAYMRVKEVKGEGLTLDSVSLSAFNAGDAVTVSGVSKGKGFQGGVKRHGFRGDRRTHGRKHSERKPGSIGVGGVQRVLKGLRMAGRMGTDNITVKNLTVAHIDTKENLIFVKGAVPGRKGTLLKIVAA